MCIIKILSICAFKLEAICVWRTCIFGAQLCDIALYTPHIDYKTTGRGYSFDRWLCRLFLDVQ